MKTFKLFLTMFFIYLILGFYETSLNIKLWSDSTRFVFSGFALIILVIVLMIQMSEERPKRKPLNESDLY